MPYAVILVTALSVPDFFLADFQPPPIPAEDVATAVEKRRKGAKLSEADRLAQIRTKFLRQFVKTVRPSCFHSVLFDRSWLTACLSKGGCRTMIWSS